jgi:hypothetical protein
VFKKDGTMTREGLMTHLTRRPGFWPVLPAILILAACGSSTEPEPVEALTRSSEHFEFLSNTARATEAEMDFGIQEAEAHWAAISALIGPEHTPDAKITVVLDGDYNPDRTGAYVDDRGRIRVTRYREDLGGYFGPLAHEIAHAMRYTYWHTYNVGPWENFGYIEEGYAEWAAIHADPDKAGFPFYGYDPDVITGHRLVRGEGIPQQVMRERHDLNSPCEWQTYALRASWFRYLEATYGRQTILDIAFSTVETTDERIETLLGATLAEVDVAWEQWQRDRYSAIPDAAAIAAPYFEKFSGQRICVEGEDW